MASGREPDAGAAPDWVAVEQELSRREPASLDAEELELLADALFWMDRPHGSATARRSAYRAHLARGDVEAAALATWRLFYDHYLVGESSVAAGWLERCRRHLSDQAESRAAGWLAVAESDVARDLGEPGRAQAHARLAHEVGRNVDDPDLRAMALLAEGRGAIADRQRQRGLGLLDEAMVAVINDELESLYTGWVFCGVVSACYELADLRRATEWSDAALRWCRTLRHGEMYPGLCRVYAAELALLRGEWSDAESGARRACEQLMAHDPRYAGTAFYVVGEARRLAGDGPAAREAYDRAHRLGRLPQPGLALLDHTDGRRPGAVVALRSALEPGPAGPLPRGQLLAALVEVATAMGQLDVAAAASGELTDLAAAAGSVLLTALSDGATGRLLAAGAEPAAAVVRLRRSVDGFLVIGASYDAARHRIDLGLAAEALGDPSTARLELLAAADDLARLGAGPMAAEVEERVASLGHRRPGRGGGDDRATEGQRPRRAGASPLTPRELDVLRLVAEGRTNRAIAAQLVVSPHTVARHLSNIFSKLGVESRAAATASALRRGLLAADPPGRRP